MQNPLKTALILPVYNEENYIADVIRKALPYVDEVVVVDDGSADSSFEKARETNATVVRHALNLGKSDALKTGVEAAIQNHAEILIFMDSDGQHLPEDIPRFIALIEAGEADLVIGVREGGDKMPFLRSLGNRLLEFMLKWLYGLNARDVQSGFRAFRSSDYPKLRWQSKRYHADAEITVRAAKQRLKCREVKIKTIYHDPHKGMTMLDGLGLLLRALVWKFKL